MSNYSWMHKGSSKSLSKGFTIPKTGEKGYEKKPAFIPPSNTLSPVGEVDLMKYFEFGVDAGFQKASDLDVKMLVWLSRIEVG